MNDRFQGAAAVSLQVSGGTHSDNEFKYTFQTSPQGSLPLSVADYYISTFWDLGFGPPAFLR